MKEVFTGLARAIIVLFVLLIIMNAVKMVMNSSSDNSSSEEIIDTKDGVNVNKSTSYDNKYNYKTLFDRYNYAVYQENFGSDFRTIYFDNTLTNEFYLFASVIDLTKSNYVIYCNGQEKIEENVIKSKIKDLFGDVDYTPVSYTNDAKTFSITYNEKDKNYTVVNKKCSGLEANEGHVDTVFLGGKSTDNLLEVYITAHYIDYENDNGLLKVIHYKDINPTSSKVPDPNIDNVFAKYKMIFTKNGEYITLTKIEKVA